LYNARAARYGLPLLVRTEYDNCNTADEDTARSQRHHMWLFVCLHNACAALTVYVPLVVVRRCKTAIIFQSFCTKISSKRCAAPSLLCKILNHESCQQRSAVAGIMDRTDEQVGLPPNSFV